MQITIKSGPQAGRLLTVDRELSVGRAPDSDLVLDDDQVSTLHARLVPVNGGVDLVDAGSTNGTFVDDRRISTATRLQNGQTIKIGHTEMVVSAGTIVSAAPGAGTVVAAPAGVVPTLSIVDGAAAGRSLSMPIDGAFSLGRDDTCDLVIPDPEVSGKHAVVRRVGSTLHLRDAGSRNGTILNGTRITDERQIGDNDQIRLGQTELVVRAGGRPATQVQSRPAAAAPRASRRGIAAGVAGVAALGAVVAFAATRGDDSKPAPTTTAAASTTASASSTTVASTTVATSTAASTTASTTTPEPATELTTKQIINLNRDATLQVIVQDSDGTPVSVGSGSVIDKAQGLILTNNHVAGGATKLVVRRNDDRKQMAVKLVAALPCDDLALLQVESPADRALLTSEVKLGDSTRVEQGDHVVALGYPLDVEIAEDASIPLNATDGVVSKVSTKVGELQSLVQHTASINGGNSGGPLFNAVGEQVGINTLGATQLNDVYLSISSGRALELLDQMRKGYSAKWIGADVQPVTDNDNQPLGLAIQNLVPFGPADRAQMLPGTVIVAVNRRRVRTEKQFCQQMPPEPGTRVNIVTVDPQTGKQQTWRVVPGKK